MKIVYSILGTFNFGGMERVLSNKANYLTKLGYEIIILTTDQKGRKPYFELDSRIKNIDLNINYTDDLSLSLPQKLLSYVNKQRKHYKALEKQLVDIKADVVISMFDNDSSFLYKINDGSKKVLEIHFSRFKRLQYGRKGILKWIDKYRSLQDVRIAQKYDRFVVLTEEDKQYWGDLNNIQVIPNANSFSSEKVALLENKKVLAIGRFDYQKGFDNLIHSWKIINNKFPDWILNIYGHGSLKSMYEHLIIQLGLEDTVVIHDSTKDIQQVYLEHSILAMTSRYEGLPMVLLEGQVFGLPLVSYVCKCGPKDIISDGYNGYLVEEGDILPMADKLMILMKDEELRKRMGINSKLNSNNYSEDVIMKKWIALFDHLISQ